MKVCVFGAGAIGGHAATRLIAARAAEVSVVTRGRQLEAIRARGLTLLTGGKEITGKPVAATDDPSSLPPQDVVLVTLKAHSLPGVADSLARLVAPQGAIVFVLNGIPWWWRLGQPGAAGPLPLLDPAGALWTKLREKTLGCVVYGPVEVQEPGVIFHFSGNRWLIGEPDGSKSARLEIGHRPVQRGRTRRRDSRRPAARGLAQGRRQRRRQHARGADPASRRRFRHRTGSPGRLSRTSCARRWRSPRRWAGTCARRSTSTRWRGARTRRAFAPPCCRTWTPAATGSGSAAGSDPGLRAGGQSRRARHRLHRADPARSRRSLRKDARSKN